MSSVLYGTYSTMIGGRSPALLYDSVSQCRSVMSSTFWRPQMAAVLLILLLCPLITRWQVDGKSL